MTPPLHDEMSELLDRDTGRFEVQTESSMYLVDLTDFEDRGLIRAPGLGAGAVPGDGEVATSSLRRDFQRLALLSIEVCAVGRRGQFVVQMPSDQPDLIENHVGTLRHTTIVRRITKTTRIRAN